MKEILSLQQQFKTHLYKKNDEKILSMLPYSRTESLARLNIYRNNVFGNFSSVLSSIFEVVEKLVGAEYFEQLCDSYNQKFYSKSGNLDNYGDNFPAFLTKEKNKHKLVFLPDVAKLELLYHKSYFADGAPVFDLKKFKKLPQEKFFDLHFTLHPSCFLITSKFPIFSIWQDNIENGGKKKISLKNPESAMVERASQKVNIHKLDREEFLFLKNITQKTLFETYKEISRITKKECDIGQILNKFITSGIITNFNNGAKND
jgi:hypothetical protein